VARILLAISLALSLSLLTAPAPTMASGGGRYVPVTPSRILDTRTGAGPVQVGTTLNLPVVGHGGVPAGASAVVLNLTVTAPAGAGFLTVWPTGGTMPLASSVSFAAGQTVAGLVQVGLGTNGQVSIYAANTLQLIADVEGWVNPAATGSAGQFNALSPARLLDTRYSNQIAPAGMVSVAVRGQAGVPATGVSAVVLNLTVTNPAAGGFITAWPHDVVPRPLASNINFSAGQTIANRAIVAVGASGLVDFYNGGGAVDLIVDVSGWFTDASATTGGDYFALAPTRFLDTRTTHTPIGPANMRALQLSGVNGLPAMGGAGSPSAVVATITVTNPAAGGFVTAWPGGGYARPLASDLNWSAGSTVANLVVVALGPSGVIDLYNGGGTADFIVDVVGYYVGQPLPPPPAGSVMATRINQDRSAAGLAPLQWVSCLATIAQGESQRQANAGAISHAGGVQLDLGCGYTTAGENVGYWSGGIDDAQLNTMFMNSPGHRANILNPNFRVVGTAWVVAPNGYGYISEEFAG